MLLPRSCLNYTRNRWREFVEHVLCEYAGRIVLRKLILANLSEHSPVSSDLREHCARGLALAAATYDAVPMCAGACRIELMVLLLTC